jgi:hypothetical protein
MLIDNDDITKDITLAKIQGVAEKKIVYFNKQSQKFGSNIRL